MLGRESRFIATNPRGAAMDEHLASGPGSAGADRYLLCHSQGVGFALPLECVLETMRPLPIVPLADMPRFVRGLCIIRGEPLPVIDALALTGEDGLSSPGRFVALQTGPRRAALAVEEVLGVRALPGSLLQKLPPLLKAEIGVVSAIGRLDGELFLALETARLVPESVWEALQEGAAP